MGDRNDHKDKKQSSSLASSKITRRDFVGGSLVGSGAALLTAKAPGLVSKAEATSINGPSSEFPQTINAPLTGLTKAWTGPGGVGDYKNSNGNTHLEANAGHAFRNSDFKKQVQNATVLDEEYDLVIVGAGFAGCGAAYYYLKDHPNAKVLICDNHEVFGGEARHNEFEVDGYKLWAPQGSTGAAWPLEKAKIIILHQLHALNKGGLAKLSEYRADHDAGHGVSPSTQEIPGNAGDKHHPNIKQCVA